MLQCSKITKPLQSGFVIFPDRGRRKMRRADTTEPAFPPAAKWDRPGDGAVAKKSLKACFKAIFE